MNSYCVVKEYDTVSMSSSSGAFDFEFSIFITASRHRIMHSSCKRWEESKTPNKETDTTGAFGRNPNV